MKKWVYVQALAPSPFAKDDPISFRHTIVEAEDAEDAYDKGGSAFDDQPGQLLNDYVVEVP